MTLPVTEQARQVFPRGLSQPESGFRFSMDALLLAAFAGRQTVQGRILDLGTGCGVVGLSLALDHPDFLGIGLDVSLPMLVHARENACRLGLDGRFLPFCADVREPACLAPESMDLVLCNPPYREPGSGRICADQGKSVARFERLAGLDHFVRAAAFLLRNRKSCVFIHLAERADDLLAHLTGERLRPKEILFVHPRADAEARLVLVRGVKNARSGLRVLPPLVLHEGSATSTRLTESALSFCPRLACNAGPAGE